MEVVSKISNHSRRQTVFSLFISEMPVRTTHPYFQAILLFDTFDLSHEMPAMLKNSIESHTVDCVYIMMDHFMDHQFLEHFLIQVYTSGYPNMPYSFSFWCDTCRIPSKRPSHVHIGESAHREFVVEVYLIILHELLFQDFFCYFHARVRLMVKRPGSGD